MKFLKGLLIFFLTVVIIGGLGYIGLNYYYMPYMGNTSGTPSTNAQPGTSQNNQNNMAGMGNMGGMGNMAMPGSESAGSQTPATTNTMTYSTVALQNKDSLTQVIAAINQALDMITMDPYSMLTVPGGVIGTATQQSVQTNPETGTVNIYPNGNTSVNVNPNSTAEAAAGGAPKTVLPSAANINDDTNYVYDQTKLEQLHRGIFKLAQGVMLLNRLNSDLTVQAGMVETNTMSYQSYINRYNTVLMNKTKLDTAVNMINEASDLVNVNPYASRNGYQYDVQAMNRLHQGIYKLAQGMVLASELDEDFTEQMVTAAVSAQYAYSGGSMPGMNMTSGKGIGSLFGSVNMASVLNIILVVLVITLILSIFGAISQMFKGKKRIKNNEIQHDNSNT